MPLHAVQLSSPLRSCLWCSRLRVAIWSVYISLCMFMSVFTSAIKPQNRQCISSFQQLSALIALLDKGSWLVEHHSCHWEQSKPGPWPSVALPAYLHLSLCPIKNSNKWSQQTLQFKQKHTKARKPKTTLGHINLLQGASFGIDLIFNGHTCKACCCIATHGATDVASGPKSCIAVTDDQKTSTSGLVD